MLIQIAKLIEDGFFSIQKLFSQLFLGALAATFQKCIIFDSFSFGDIVHLLDLLALRFLVVHFGFVFDTFGPTSASFDSFLTLRFLFLHYYQFIVFIFESRYFGVDLLDRFGLEKIREKLMDVEFILVELRIELLFFYIFGTFRSTSSPLLLGLFVGLIHKLLFR